MSSQSSVHTIPVAVGAGVTGLGAALTTDQLVKAAHGPHTKSHLAKAALGAAMTGAAFEITKGLAEPDEDFTDKSCERESHRSSHSRSRSGSSHSTHHARGLIAAPPPPPPPGPPGVTVNVGAVGGACPPMSQAPDSIEEYTTETDEESRREYHRSHDSEHHRHHHRHRESHSEHEEPPHHHKAHLLEEAVGAYGIVKELLGDKHHHALHAIEGLIGAHAVGKEARDS